MKGQPTKLAFCFSSHVQVTLHPNALHPTSSPSALSTLAFLFCAAPTPPPTPKKQCNTIIKPPVLLSLVFLPYSKPFRI